MLHRTLWPLYRSQNNNKCDTSLCISYFIQFPIQQILHKNVRHNTSKQQNYSMYLLFNTYHKWYTEILTIYKKRIADEGRWQDYLEEGQ